MDNHIHSLPVVSQVQLSAVIPVDDPSPGGWITKQISIGQIIDAVAPSASIPNQTGHNNKFLRTDGATLSWATINALPAQIGHSGKFLTTNGTTASWVSVPAIPSQSGNSGRVLSTNGTALSWIASPLVPDQTGQSGKFLSTNGTALNWRIVPVIPPQTGQQGRFLTTDGTDPIWAVIRQVPSVSGQTGKFLTNDGDDLAWAVIGNANSIAIPSIDSKTDHVLQTDGDTVFWESRFQLPNQDGNAGKVLKSDGTDPFWSNPPTERLATGLTLHVRSDGNDSNTGLGNSPSTSLLTLQAALNRVADWDIANHPVNIRLVDDTEVQGCITIRPPRGNGTFTIDSVTGAKIIGKGSVLDGGPALIQNLGARVFVNGIGLELESGWNGEHFLFRTSDFGSTTFRAVDFGLLLPDATGQQASILVETHSHVHFFQSGLSGDRNIVSGGGDSDHAFFILARGHSSIGYRAPEVNGSPEFHTWVRLEDNSSLRLNTAITASGYTGTGIKKFHVTHNSSIFLNGGSVDAFPGDVTGTEAHGGVVA